MKLIRGFIRLYIFFAIVILLAACGGGTGNLDDNGSVASFNHPRTVATDGAGNVYVADVHNHAIRKITPTGEVSTLAGTVGVSGSADGNGTAASFNFPTGVATDSAGNVYVGDSGNHTIRKITPTGDVSTLAGTAGVFGSTDGIGSAASFDFPVGVATDSAGNVYVADFYNHTIRKITPTGDVRTLAGTTGMNGSADGNGSAARFFNPAGLATDSTGNIYIADTFNNTIRKMTPAGDVSTFAGTAGM